MSPATRIGRPFVIVTKSDAPSSPLQRLFIRGLVAEGVHAQDGRLAPNVKALLEARPDGKPARRNKSKKSI
jgi:hypothetical protein